MSTSPTSGSGTTATGAFGLDAATRTRVVDRLEQAVRRARAEGREVLTATTVQAGERLDPTAIAYASRRAGERWFCFEQPDRQGFSLAALGAVRTLEARGADRFGEVAAAWRALAADGGSAPHWAGFAPASLVVPEVALARRDGVTWLTLVAAAAPDDTSEGLLAALEGRLGELRAAPLPLLDPAPAERARVAGAMPPQHYVSAVARAVERIRAGELEKVVLAREVEVHAPAPHDPGAILGVLREAFPQCFVFAAGVGDAAFVAASPELLVRREGQRASTLALAGSTMANIQHLATPIRVQLAEPIGAVDLAGLLHPTPAVGGEPFARAEHLIPELEGLDRGWYAGPVGWTDAAEDGEFCVALRCALLRGPVARCYAGVGVVRDSDPAAELAETEVKLEALLPVLAG